MRRNGRVTFSQRTTFAHWLIRIGRSRHDCTHFAYIVPMMASDVGRTTSFSSTEWTTAWMPRAVVDVNGDGRRDLVRSVPDVLASTANYFKQKGWRRGEAWGPGTPNFEVIKEWNKADVYARTTLGYLEEMYGGVSTEVLWKPADSRLGLGAEVNYARQRDFDLGFGFQDYDVVTGHASAYYDFDNRFERRDTRGDFDFSSMRSVRWTMISRTRSKRVF